MGRIEQSDYDPSIRELVQVSDEKMRVILFDHFCFKPLAEFCLPTVAVLPSPTTVRFPHLPVCTDHGVARAEQFLAPKDIAEIKRDFFEFLLGCLLKQRPLAQSFKLLCAPLRLAWLDNQSLNLRLNQSQCRVAVRLTVCPKLAKRWINEGSQDIPTGSPSPFCRENAASFDLIYLGIEAFRSWVVPGLREPDVDPLILLELVFIIEKPIRQRKKSNPLAIVSYSSRAGYFHALSCRDWIGSDGYQNTFLDKLSHSAAPQIKDRSRATPVPLAR